MAEGYQHEGSNASLSGLRPKSVGAVIPASAQQGPDHEAVACPASKSAPGTPSESLETHPF